MSSVGRLRESAEVELEPGPVGYLTGDEVARDVAQADGAPRWDLAAPKGGGWIIGQGRPAAEPGDVAAVGDDDLPVCRAGSMVLDRDFQPVLVREQQSRLDRYEQALACWHAAAMRAELAMATRVNVGQRMADYRAATDRLIVLARVANARQRSADRPADVAPTSTGSPCDDGPDCAE